MNKVNHFRIAAIVPAAGVGSRMQASCPKQYLLINNKTIIEHTLSVLLTNEKIELIIVVLHPDDDIFATLPISTHRRVMSTQGGNERLYSVKAGLQLLDEYDWVLVHDAARPCLRAEDLERLIQQAMLSEHGGILAMPAKDTIKQADKNSRYISHTLDRQLLWHALTPQMFPQKLLKLCLERVICEDKFVTDESAALEYCGFHPLLIEGRSDNIKITHQEDLVLAKFLLEYQTAGEAN